MYPPQSLSVDRLWPVLCLVSLHLCTHANQCCWFFICLQWLPKLTINYSFFIILCTEYNMSLYCKGLDGLVKFMYIHVAILVYVNCFNVVTLYKWLEPVPHISNVCADTLSCSTTGDLRDSMYSVVDNSIFVHFKASTNFLLLADSEGGDKKICQVTVLFIGHLIVPHMRRMSIYLSCGKILVLIHHSKWEHVMLIAVSFRM